MVTKKCTTCRTEKPVSEFGTHARTSDGLRGECRECATKLTIEWRQADPERASESSKSSYQRRVAANKKRVAEYKATTGCQRCGTHEGQLWFSHRAGTERVASVSQMMHRAWRAIEAEIDKCELFCPNCYANRRDEETATSIKAAQDRMNRKTQQALEALGDSGVAS